MMDAWKPDHRRASSVFVLFVAAFTLIIPIGSGEKAPIHDPKFNSSSIRQVHVVFMNHLDVGFNGFLDDILNKYFHSYFPMAIQRANELRSGGYVESFIYTTHPWLVSMFLDCPEFINLRPGAKLQCPSNEEVKNFTEAVKDGIITWHAGPMNMQFEVLDESLLDLAMNLSLSLDKRFGFNRKYRTLSQRDVPGMTQAVIPVLVKQGIYAVTVGVNAASAPPALPKIFNWEFNGQRVLAMWHPNGYPDSPGPNPARPGGLSTRDCVTIDGFEEALCFAFRSDNDGPPRSLQEILGNFEILRAEFPNATLTASSLEQFVQSVSRVRDQLPTIKQEVGDTWIQGIQSDPRKVAEMRLFLRSRATCLSKGACLYSDPRFFNSSRLLLKTGEHTWGRNGVFDTINWSNSEFQKIKNTTKFTDSEASWIAQRHFTYFALEALGDHPLSREIIEDLVKLQPSKPDLSDYHADDILVYKCSNGIQIGFNSTSGYINQLSDPLDQMYWASESNGLAKFLYATYNQSDFDAMDKAYTYATWFSLGVEKPNITKNAFPEHKLWDLKLQQFYRRKGDAKCDFYAHLQMSDPQTVTKYGAPKDVWIHYKVTDSRMPRQGVDVTVQWFSKQATRMPEAVFLSFEPTLQDNFRWFMSKSGRIIDPMNVVRNGSQRLHAIDKGVMYMDQTGKGIEFTSSDVALVSTMTDSLEPTSFPVPLHQTDAISGIAYNMFNNVWNVNYIFWYPFQAGDEDFKARFSINLLHGKSRRFRGVHYGTFHENL